MKSFPIEKTSQVNKRSNNNNKNHKITSKHLKIIIDDDKGIEKEPLKNFIFFLDVDDYQTSINLERHIKKLGGIVKNSLTEEVSHLITDKSYHRNLNQLNSLISHNSYLVSNIPFENDKGFTARNSFANAMYNRISRTGCADSSEKRIVNLTKLSPGGLKIANRPKDLLIWHFEHAVKLFENYNNLSSVNPLSATSVAASSANISKSREDSVNPEIAVSTNVSGINKRIHETKPNAVNKTSKRRNTTGHELAKPFLFKYSNYLKIESVEKGYRPYYVLIKNKWPKFDLYDFSTSKGSDNIICNNNPLRKSASTLTTQKQSQTQQQKQEDKIKVETNSNMTRKGKTPRHIDINSIKDKVPSEKACGFCELCRVEYDILSIHLNTIEHLNFLKDENNFLALDSLINSSTNVKNFLKMSTKKKVSCKNNSTTKNKECCEDSSNTILNTTVTKPVVENGYNNHVKSVSSEREKDILARQTRQSSMRQLVKHHESSLNNINTNNSNNLRSKRECARRINYQEPTDDTPPKEDLLKDLINVKKKVKKTSRVSGDRTSVKNFHKIPIMNDSLIYKVVKKESDDNVEDSKEENEETEKEGKPIIVKIRKMRRSELSVLSDEAESFMFPKKILEEICSESHTRSSHIHSKMQSPTTPTSLSSSNPQTSPFSNKFAVDLLSSSPNVKRKSQSTQSKIENTPLEKKRRISFSLENDLIPPLPKEVKERENSEMRPPHTFDLRNRRNTIKGRKNNKKSLQKEISEKEKEKCTDASSVKGLDMKSIEDKLREYKFAFERVPFREPWYSVFNRQDESVENIFEFYGNTAYKKLPYEMGPLPMKKATCKLCTEDNKILSAALDKQRKSSQNDNHSDDEERTAKNSEESHTKRNSLNKKSPYSKLSKKTAARLLNFNMPRKSPREHASTLAILSCLVKQQRGDRSPTKVATISSDRGMNDSTTINSGLRNCNQFSSINATTNSLPNKQNSNDSRIEEDNGNYFRKVPVKSIGKKNSTITELDSPSLSSVTASNPKNDVNIHQLKKDIDDYLQGSLVECPDIMENLYDINAPTVPEHNTSFGILHSLETPLVSLLNNQDEGDMKVENNKKVAKKVNLFSFIGSNKKRRNRTGWPKKKKPTTRYNINTGPTASTETENAISNPIHGEIKTSTRDPASIIQSADNYSIINESSDVKKEIPEEDHKLNQSDRESFPSNLLDKSRNYKSTTNSKCNNISSPPIAINNRRSGTEAVGATTINNAKGLAGEVLTISSDSLDTVLDVGSQIKTEDQKEIIQSSSSKYTNLSQIIHKKNNFSPSSHSSQKIKKKKASKKQKKSKTKFNLSCSSSASLNNSMNNKLVNTIISSSTNSSTTIVNSNLQEKLNNNSAQNCTTNFSDHNHFPSESNISSNVAGAIANATTTTTIITATTTTTTTAMTNNHNFLNRKLQNAIVKIERSDFSELHPSLIIQHNHQPQQQQELRNHHHHNNHHQNQIDISLSISPRRLRKPRGSWYKER